MMRNNAEIVVDALEKTGVRYLFGYPGGQNARFIEALRGSRVEFVLVTHEASAGFMADVYARMTGTVGACLSTLGPGATNMTTGVGNAFLDRVPLLAFTARMGTSWHGRTVQMQIDHRQLYLPITKWSAVLKTGRIYSTLKKAVEVATAEQPGPVHLDFPEDVAEESSQESPARFHPAPPSLPPFDQKALGKAIRLIQKSKYPLVAVGLTMNRAHATPELRAFLDKHRLPAVSTLMAKGQVAEQGSTFIGVVGRARREIVAEYCKPADLILAIGYDPIEFNYEEWVKRDVPIVHIDTVAADVARGIPAPCNVIGNIRDILAALSSVARIEHRWDLEALRKHRQRLRQSLTPAQRRFSPHHAILAMRELFPKDGILATDVGAHTHLVGQLWETGGPGNLVVSNGWSSMGFGIPAAIAAKLAQPHRPCLACMGDGGFLMMVGEINTAVRLRLPVVFVLLRDNFLSLIKVKQSRKQFPSHGVEIFGSNYRPSDNFFGAKVVPVDTEESFREALKQALQGSEPVIIDAKVDPAEYEDMI